MARMMTGEMKGRWRKKYGSKKGRNDEWKDGKEREKRGIEREDEEEEKGEEGKKK